MTVSPSAAGLASAASGFGSAAAAAAAAWASACSSSRRRPISSACTSAARGRCDVKSFRLQHTSACQLHTRCVPGIGCLCRAREALHCNACRDICRERLGKPTSSRQQGASQRQSQTPGQGVPDAETIRLQSLGNTEALAQLRAFSTELAEAIHDPVDFKARFDEVMNARKDYEKRQRERQEEYLRLQNADEFDMEAQTRSRYLCGRRYNVHELHQGYSSVPGTRLWEAQHW